MPSAPILANDLDSLEKKFNHSRGANAEKITIFALWSSHKDVIKLTALQLLVNNLHRNIIQEALYREQECANTTLRFSAPWACDTVLILCSVSQPEISCGSWSPEFCNMIIKCLPINKCLYYKCFPMVFICAAGIWGRHRGSSSFSWV